jgi:hypothetical protein
MLDPSGAGINLLVLLLGAGGDSAGAVKHDEPGAGCALIEGPDVAGHVAVSPQTVSILMNPPAVRLHLYSVTLILKETKMENKPQTAASHAMWDPMFHFVLAPIALINVIVALVQLVRSFSLGAAWIFVVSFAFLVAVSRMRAFAVGLQDRIIRLEERIRLGSLLQEPLRSRIGELSTDQLVGLRFASDGEVAGLVKRALDEKLDRKAIKQAIKEWRPDYARV